MRRARTARGLLLGAAAALAVVGCGLLDTGGDAGPRDEDAGGDASADAADAFVPSSTIGSSCVSDLDCQAVLGFGATCLRGSAQADGIVINYPDGYCSLPCSLGFDGSDSCPEGSRCVVPQGAAFGFCGASCQSSRHCRAPVYCCVQNAFTGVKVCAAPADPITYCGL